jgi:hypothetical protein
MFSLFPDDLHYTHATSLKIRCTNSLPECSRRVSPRVPELTLTNAVRSRNLDATMQTRKHPSARDEDNWEQPLYGQ